MAKSGSNGSAGKARLSKRAVVQQLRSAELAGVTHLRKLPPQRSKSAPSNGGRSISAKVTRDAALQPPRPSTGSSVRSVPTAVKAIQPVAAAMRAEAPSAKPLFSLGSGPARSRQDRIAALNVLRDEVAGCVRCPELAQTRHKTVFGVGDPEARLCFLGEAPGADEDRQGEPFVGRAGQLLTKIIEACKLRRDDVYILNVLKCRPPGNRNPLPDEAANCRGYLEGQLEMIRPEFICCLGAVAARMLLDTQAPIGKLRKQFFNYGPSQVLCTYHPAFLLRNPSAKKDVWEDMQLLMARMGMPLGKES